MKPTPTERGFMRSEFKDVDGELCTIQESSAAMVGDVEGPFLWLGVHKPQLKLFPGDGTGCHDYKLPENVYVFSRMHLSQEQVREMLPLLQHFAEHGELPKGGG